MSENGGSSELPPFPPESCASGLLLHVTSLASPYGIGDLESATHSLVDLLHGAGQRWWQSLPLGPAGYGNVEFDTAVPFKARLLQVAWQRFRSASHTDLRSEYDEFRSNHEHWLDDYSRFRALRRRTTAHITSIGQRGVRRQPCSCVIRWYV